MSVPSLRMALRVAALELRDLRRSGGVLFLVVGLPMLYASFVVLLPGYFERREEEELARRTYDVAVAGTRSDVAALTPLLPERTKTAIVKEPDEVVLDRDADIGVTLPRGLADALASGEQVEIELHYVGSRSSSQRAFGLVAQSLHAAGVRLAADRLQEAGVPPDSAVPIRASLVDLTRTAEGSRFLLARVAPLLLGIPLLNLVAVVSRLITGRKESRTLEPLLLLPIRRSELLLGMGIAGTAIGLMSLPGVAVPLVATTRFSFGAAGRPVSLPADAAAGILVAALLFVPFVICFGLLSGAAAREGGTAGAVIGALQPVVTLTALGLQFVSAYVNPWAAGVPVGGPLVLMQQVLVRRATAATYGLCLASTILTCAVMAWLALRMLQSDRSVLRATG